MVPAFTPSRLAQVGQALLLCRGCLGALGPGAEAGLCAPCWNGLLPLPDIRCPRCALVHGSDGDGGDGGDGAGGDGGDGGGACPEATGWAYGDALWDYHGGRPPLGALLLPAIKAGEAGWRKALVARLNRAPLPEWTAEVDQVTSVPSSLPHRWLRGFDLSEEAGRLLAGRLDRPFQPLLVKHWLSGRQAARSESRRRRLPRKAVSLRAGSRPSGCILLVDDVWTTGTTLLRCAQALREGGADEVRVLTLFRAQ